MLQSFWFVGGLLALMLAPFAALESSNFRFGEWLLWPASAPPQGWLLLSMAGKLIVFVDPRAARGEKLVGLGAALLLTAAQVNLIDAQFQVAAALLLLIASIVVRLVVRTGSRVQGSHALWVASILLIHHALVRVPTDAYYWQDCLLATVGLQDDSRSHRFL